MNAFNLKFISSVEKHPNLYKTKPFPAVVGRIR
jgi:hypothetical protein